MACPVQRRADDHLALEGGERGDAGKGSACCEPLLDELLDPRLPGCGIDLLGGSRRDA
jgi:hypothetical protein